MPLYDFVCRTCGKTVEIMASYESLTTTKRTHTGACGGTLKYAPAFKTGVARPEMGAVLADGRRVPGMFGKEAPRKRRKK